MRAIKVDPVTRDPIMRSGQFQWVDGIDAVMQNCEHAMRQQLGELQYDKQKGVEYLNNAFTGNPNFQAFEFQARREIENVEGVTRVQSFSYSLDGTELRYNAVIKTKFGEGVINGSL